MDQKQQQKNITKRDPLLDFGITVGRVKTGPHDSKKWEITFLSRQQDGSIKTDSQILSKSSAIGTIAVLAEKLVKHITWPNGGQQ